MHFNDALRIKPDYADARANLSRTLHLSNEHQK
jgi:hypothetical protein